MSKPSHIPHFYRPPHGLPLRWQDDASGELPVAVLAFVGHAAGIEKAAPTPEQIALITDYLRYYINAPCWKVGADPAILAELRASVQALQNAEEIDAWLKKCLEVGLDPL